MTNGPPDLLIRLLEASLPPGVRGQSIIGDLGEEWHARRPGPGRALWFTAAALGLSLRYATARAGSWCAHSLRASGGALRRALRRPLQTGLTVLALGVGIAAPATMFSIVRGLVGDLDLEEPDRLVHVGRRFSPRVIGIAQLDWLWPGLDRIEGLETVGIYSRREGDLSADEGHPVRLAIALVSPGTLEAFGVEPVLGRSFRPGDATGGGAPVILGWDLWQSRFGGDRSILGRTVRVNGHARPVVGIMPEGFQYPMGVDIWAPLDPSDASQAEVANYQGVGRLGEGVTVEGVRSRVQALNSGLRVGGEEVPRARGLDAELWRYSLIAAQDRRMLTVMVLVVGFVLVIACADVLNLLLAKALSRSRDTAIRAAMGASRSRIVGEHLAEAGVLAVLAGLVGLGLTAAAVRTFEVQTAGQLAHWMEIRMDLPVLLFGAGMVALAALGTGLVPAIQSSRLDVAPALRDGRRGSSAFRIGRISRALVAGEVALSCALLVMAGVMVRGAVSNLRTDGSYATSSVLAARYELRQDAYDDDQARAFNRRLLEELRSHPGIAEAAVTSHLPGAFSFSAPRRVELEGSPEERSEDLPVTHAVSVSPSFFSTMESRVLRGRGLTWEDGLGGTRAVVVNDAFVQKHLQGRDPLGARIRLHRRGSDDREPEEWATIVGVVPPLGIDVGQDLDGTGVYVPASAEPLRRTAILIRAAAGTDPLSLLPEVRDLAAKMDPNLALWDVDTLAGHIETTRILESVFAVLFLTFGLAGLLLAAVGLYGLLAFSVRRRVRELGVRIALGAAPSRVLRTAVGSGLVQTALGLAVGLALGALVAPLLGQALLGGDPRDPLVYATVAVVLGLTGLAAALKPASRALRVDVVEALRTE